MSQLAKAGEEACLNAVFRSASPVYLALATNAQGSIDDNTLMSSITEPGDTSYVRKQITFGAPTQVSNATTITNSAQIDYTAWVANQATNINYALIVDNSTKGSGNILGYYQLTTPLAPQSGQPLRVSTGNISISLD